jgi:hypothetical protein
LDEHKEASRTDQNSVTERLAEAVESGDCDAKAIHGQRLLDGVIDNRWQLHIVDEGAYAPLEAFSPERISDWGLDLLEADGVIDGERKRVLEAGAPLSPDELGCWREIVARNSLAPEVELLWLVLEATLAGRRRIYIAATARGNQSASEVLRSTFMSARSSYTDVMDDLKARGFIGLKDYRARLFRDIHFDDRGVVQLKIAHACVIVESLS